MRIRRILAALLLLATCFVLTACGGPEATYKQAQELLSKGKYADAAKEFESLGSYEDAIRLTMYCKACVLCESGNYETGIAALENLGDYKDCQMRITYYTARSWDDGSAGTTEFEWMQRAKSIYNENLLYLDSMERVAALDKRIEKAKADLYDAAEKAGKKGNYAEAQRIFDRLGYYQDSAKRSAYYGIRANEDALTASADPDTLFAVATRYSNMGNFLDCADRARSLTAKADKLVADQYARVASLVKAGKCAEAETLLASFWKYGNEKVPENYYAIAEKYLAQKEWDAASAAFKKAGDYSDAKSRINEPYYRQGDALIEEGKWSEATSAFFKAGKYSDAGKRIDYCYLRHREDSLSDSDSQYWLVFLAAEYQEMGDYLDCADRANALIDRANAINEGRYLAAVAFLEAGNYIDAYDAFLQIASYKDSKEKAQAILNEHPKVPYQIAEVGDYVTFGSYEQDNNADNGKEDIQWLVLAKENNRLLVISSAALDTKPYNTSFNYYIDNSWETCSVRSWLNRDFLNAAFTGAEQAMIPTVTVTVEKNPDSRTNPGNDTQDKIFLLSVSEANQYFASDSDRQCKPTTYAKQNGAYTDRNGFCWWWLRSTGLYIQDLTANVNLEGDVHALGYGCSVEVGTIRPALWIDLNP